MTVRCRRHFVVVDERSTFEWLTARLTGPTKLIGCVASVNLHMSRIGSQPGSASTSTDKASR